MTKFIKLIRASIAISSLISVGCSPSLQPKQEYSPFVFSQLRLNKTNNEGKPLWSIKSPEARYELGNRLIRAMDLEIIINNNSIPTYKLIAKSANIINDGDLILLEGDINLTQLSGDKVVIRGDRVKWDTLKSILTIDQNPLIYNENFHLVVPKVSFFHQKNILKLTGKSILTNNPRTVSTQRNRLGEYKVKVINAEWNLNSGVINGQGPIEIFRYINSTDTYQQVNGDTLFGNTKSGLLGFTSCAVIQEYEFILSNECILDINSDQVSFIGDVKLRRNTNKSFIEEKTIKLQLNQDHMVGF